MKLSVKLLFGCLLLASFAQAEVTSVPEFDTLMRKYGDDVQLSAGAIYEGGVSELKLKYTAAIERVLKAAQDAGKLEEALAYKNEINLVAEDGDLITEDKNLRPELQKLRGIYRQSLGRLEQEKNKATNPLITALNTSMDQLIVTLTKSGRLDEALFVKQKKDKLAEETGIAATKASTAVAASSALGKGAFTNTLGMKFVPVPGTTILMCIHETRNSDYIAFAAEVPGIKASPAFNPPMPAGPSGDHPVRNVRQIDAVAFCEWLSKKEGKTYRLPTDKEWSYAVGIGTKERRYKDSTPESLSGKNTDEFPWGTEWPPPEGAGNFADTAYKKAFPKDTCIEGYSDGFPLTAPVMSFKPNKLGLYDMGGNSPEWVADWWNAAEKERAYRGAEYDTKGRTEILSSRRGHLPPDVGYGNANIGFRCVLEKQK